MELYGNMPLIEENEYREARKIEELVIVIDTSASCQADLVERFLTETAAVLAEQETFFHRINLHIIECDDRVQKVLVIHDPDEMRKYLDSFEVLGGYGTDFRPAFAYVDDLQARGELKYLRGLIYFTDGYGTFPQRKPPYDTAFVFMRDESYEPEVPPWAIKLVLEEEDLV
jgi:predicted metal-dependent peptidase